MRNASLSRLGRLFSIVLGLCSHAMAQTAEKGQSITLIDPALLGFGPPGFSISVTASQSMDYDGENGSLDFYDGRVLLPALGRDLGNGTFIGASLSYGWASLDASEVLGLKKQFLQTVEVQFTAAHFPTGNQGWMGLIVASPGLASDLNKMSSDAFSFTTIAVVGYQFSSEFTLAAAGFYSHSIGENTAVPGIGVVWRPTNTVTLQLTPPIGAIGWNPVKNWTFSLVAYPAGGSWAVDRQGSERNVNALNLEVWRAGVGVEHRVDDHWRITALAGANFGGSIELRDNAQRVLLQRDLQPSAFGLLGVTWSF